METINPAVPECRPVVPCAIGLLLGHEVIHGATSHCEVLRVVRGQAGEESSGKSTCVVDARLIAGRVAET